MKNPNHQGGALVSWVKEQVSATSDPTHSIFLTYQHDDAPNCVHDGETKRDEIKASNCYGKHKKCLHIFSQIPFS